MSTSNLSATSSVGKQRTITRLVAVMGLLAGLVLALTGCFGGNKNVYQSVGSEVADGGWIIIDGDSVAFVDPDSDGVQQAIADIEEEQISPDSDAYDVERGALNEAKDTVVLEGGDSASIEFVDDLVRVDGAVVFVKYDSELAEKDRGAAALGG